MQSNVCIDPPLRAWILGFGAGITWVIAPERLVSDIGSELDAARAAYRRRAQFPMLRMDLLERRTLLSERSALERAAREA